jgi:2,3,4,5-tetrahydropyridine-2-carboxylate N-succinyltransferase
LSEEALRAALERWSAGEEPARASARALLERLLDALENGVVRAAVREAGGWRVERWVKQGILLGFRLGADHETHVPPVFHFRDRDLFPPRDLGGSGRHVRVVPGGTTVRRGAFLADGVVVMPPAFVNVGAWVGEGSMVDSHVLVGSCAQIGRGVHLSAATQIGGVLEPVGAMPVIVEDGAFVGGGCGVYEGTRIGAGAVLAPGVVLSRGTPVYDLPEQRLLRAEGAAPLMIPPRAVVVPGSRPAAGEYARRLGLQLQAAIIVKYRDAATDAAVELEAALH